jgi:hypothetical protein
LSFKNQIELFFTEGRRRRRGTNEQNNPFRGVRCSGPDRA